MPRATLLPRGIAYERAGLALATAVEVVPWALARADEGLVLVLDLVGTGRLNARHGLAAGDRVLADVGAGLRGQFCGAHERVARLPGDQFVVVLPHRTATGRAVASARRAVGRVRPPGRWRPRPALDAHVGVARWYDDASRRRVLSTASAVLGGGPSGDACSCARCLTAVGRPGHRWRRLRR